MDSFRHERLAQIEAPILYPPPPKIVSAIAADASFRDRLGERIADHEERFGADYQPGLRAAHAWWMAPRLREHGVRHVHVHFANRATHVALFLAELGFSFSFTAHAQDFMVDLGNDDLLREMADRAGFVLAVSDFSRDLLARTCPDAADKIERLYNGLHLGEFLGADPGAEGTLRIVSVGRLVEFKGFDVLLRALARLRDAGTTFSCHLVGEGPCQEELEALTAELGIEDDVHFDGLRSQDEVRALLAGANVFALACRVDSKGASDILPTVITEAMCSGLPVVSTRIAGVPEMIVDGETGCIVEPDDPEAFADALSSLAADPGLRVAYGQAGRRRAAEIFSAEVTVPDLARRLEPYVAGKDDGSRRQDVRVLYLTETWTPEDSELAAADEDPEIEVVACSVAKSEAALPAELPFFLPDPVVLEAVWSGEDTLRRRCEALRRDLPATLADETYFLDARRAVYLAESFSDMPIEVVHASRSAMARVAWLVGRLLGVKMSAAIEFEPVFPRAALAKMFAEFTFLSVGDALLAEKLPEEHEDVLGLAPAHPRQFRIGPFRIRRSSPWRQDHLDPGRQRELRERIKQL